METTASSIIEPLTRSDPAFVYKVPNLAVGYVENNYSHLFNNISSQPIRLTPQQDSQLNLLRLWMNAVFTNIVVLLGLVGNALTIIILSQRAMRSSTNVYLSALAVWDSLVLIFSSLLIGLPGIPDFFFYRDNILAYVVAYFYPIALVAQTATIWLTVSFTVERYIAVCHPLKAASMCTISRAKVVTIGVSVGSALYNIPRWLDFRPIASWDSTRNVTVVNPISTAFSMHPAYLQVYFSWLYVPIMCIIPLLVLTVMNLFLILAVRKSRQQRKDMNVRQSRENNVTIMLVSVVIVFIICQVPALVYNMAFAINHNHVVHSYSYKVLSEIRNFLVSLNSAINFLLYCALGQKFRRIFLHTFFRRCIHENYIPMSGVHNQTTLMSLPSQRRSANRVMDTRKKTITNIQNHSSTTHTTGTSRSSQESSLITPDVVSPTRILDREVHTYSAIREKRKCLQRSHDHTDSEEDAPYDVCLEHLLPESEKDIYPICKMDLASVNSTMAV